MSQRPKTAELLVYFNFDGEAVAVPTRDVGGVEAGHGFGFDDEVLNALVEGVAEVDGSVGVGWAVVEDVFCGAGTGGADLGIQVLLLPPRQASRLVLRQVGLHGEGGLGQIQGRFQQLGRCVRGVFFPANRQIQRGFQRFGSGFLIFGLGLKSVWGCVRHSFLVS